jgi:CPA2 family monovalent cation:H+ antiporter-2
MHETTLIATLAAGFGLAMLLGFLAAKLRMPPLAGYLVAGILIGPHTRGFVGDVAIAGELAEVGVMLLMFGVGLHFSFDDLAAVRRLVIPGAIIQITVAAAAGTLVARMWQWPLSASIVFGLCLSVSSTVVLLRSLESRKLLNTFNGHLALAWLVVQDIAMVLVLVLVPALAGTGKGGLIVALAATLGKLILFALFMYVVGRIIMPRLLWEVAKTGSRELFTLCVIAAAIGMAFGSAQLFGVSFALGAFFAGMMMRESALSHRAAHDSLPLQDAFAVLFFVSVGMLFDPAVLVRDPLRVLIVIAVVMIVNSAVAAVLCRAFRYPAASALVVAAALTQIGEFSFILASLGVSMGLLSADAHNLVLAAALVTIAINQFVFGAVAPLERRLRPSPAAKIDPLSVLPDTTSPAALTGHVVIAGFGRVGRRIAEALAARGIAYVVVEQSREVVEQLRRSNISAVSGDAAAPEALIQGHVARARMLVIATPDPIHVRQMVRTARMLNPRIDVVIRTHSDEEADLLRQENLGEVFMGEHELAKGMARYVLAKMPMAAPRDEGAS